MKEKLETVSLAILGTGLLRSGFSYCHSSFVVPLGLTQVELLIVLLEVCHSHPKTRETPDKCGAS